MVVAPKSELDGKTLAESQLRNHDIVVLSIERGEHIIANPKGSRRLEAGDHLLCFGKLAAMRELIPHPKRRKRRKLPRTPVTAGASS